MRFPRSRPYLFAFNPWVHIQEVRDTFKPDSDYWVRHLRIGPVMILWGAPTKRKPSNTAQRRYDNKHASTNH